MTKTEQLIKRIEINPKKLGGKPVIRGTRIAVEQVLHLLAAGAPMEEITQDFPQLELADVLAAVMYATKLMEGFQVYPREYLTQMKLQPA